MALEPWEQEALARLESRLAREDVALARALRRGVPRHDRSRRAGAAVAAAMCVVVVVGVAVFVLGIRALGALGVVLVLAAPWIATRAAEHATEQGGPAGGSVPTSGQERRPSPSAPPRLARPASRRPRR